MVAAGVAWPGDRAVSAGVRGWRPGWCVVTGEPVAVLIPWRDGVPGDGRAEAFRHVCDWWAAAHPEWPVIVGRCDDQDGPWRKGLAVWRALCRASTSVVIMADADVVCANVAETVGVVQSGLARWAMPHRMVGRMTAESTEIVYGHGRYPQPPFRPGAASMAYANVHRGAPGGGMVVVRADIAKLIPIDPRFVGWKFEDYAWARALTITAGHPHMGRELLYHHWHTPAENAGTSVSVPEPESESRRLWDRYRSAPHAEAMMALCAEAVEECRMLQERRSVRDMASLVTHGHDRSGIGD